MLYFKTFQFLLIFWVAFAASHNDSFDFQGKERWTSNNRNLCEHPEEIFSDPELICIGKLSKNFLPVRIEILAYQPLVVLFHEFATPAEYTRMIDITDESLKPAKVQGTNGVGEVLDKGRIANSTWIFSRDNVTESLSKKVESITGFDPKWAEQWHVLSYQSGGHYAPHWDYLVGAAGEDYRGNRIASFLLYLHPAEEGGGTVFPTLNVAVTHPAAGDAVLWVGMHVDGSKHDDSIHGGCPVIKGRKSAATMWIRERGQELRVKCPKDGNDFDLRSFAAGSLNMF